MQKVIDVFAIVNYSCAAAGQQRTHKIMTATKTRIIHIDHRKVEVEIRNAPKGQMLIIAIRDMGGSEMWHQKPNPTGAYIRKQWNKTYIYKKCAAWVSMSESQMHLLDEITA